MEQALLFSATGSNQGSKFTEYTRNPVDTTGTW